jgi:hypothetical protein
MLRTIRARLRYVRIAQCSHSVAVSDAVTHPERATAAGRISVRLSVLQLREHRLGARRADEPHRRAAANEQFVRLTGAGPSASTDSRWPQPLHRKQPING